VMVTVAPGMTPPLLSFTTPPILPLTLTVVCPLDDLANGGLTGQATSRSLSRRPAPASRS
jgi:hypothetical protein